MSTPEITETKGSGCARCEDCVECAFTTIINGIAGYGTVTLLF